MALYRSAALGSVFRVGASKSLIPYAFILAWRSCQIVTRSSSPVEFPTEVVFNVTMQVLACQLACAMRLLSCRGHLVLALDQRGSLAGYCAGALWLVCSWGWSVV